MKTLDREKLVAFVRRREEETRSPVGQAIYRGLRDRIERGDFDEQEES